MYWHRPKFHRHLSRARLTVLGVILRHEQWLCGRKITKRVSCFIRQFVPSLHLGGMTREQMETALDGGLLKFRQWPQVEWGRLWPVRRGGPTIIWQSRPQEFWIPVNVGKFRYRANLSHLSLNEKNWVIIPVTKVCRDRKMQTAA